jgi:transposase
MDVLYTHGAGIDVHKQSLVVCCLTPGPDGSRQSETRTVGTMTADLLRLADWLTAAGCTHVAMDSTGIYVRRITARAIPPAGRLGSEGNPGVNA